MLREKNSEKKKRSVNTLIYYADETFLCFLYAKLINTTSIHQEMEFNICFRPFVGVILKTFGLTLFSKVFAFSLRNNSNFADGCRQASKQGVQHNAICFAKLANFVEYP